MMKKIGFLSKNKIKQILINHLVSQGWSTNVTRIPDEFDIKANRDGKRWLIAVRDGESRDFVESFDSIIGRVVHIMEDQYTKNSVALPDTAPFRRLWERMPVLAKTRTSISALFVSDSGKVTEAG
jgi:hypothetical protein